MLPTEFIRTATKRDYELLIALRNLEAREQNAAQRRNAARSSAKGF